MFDFPRLAREGHEAWGRDTPSVVAFDTETEGLAFYDRPFCVTAAWRNELGVQAHYFELPVANGMVTEILDATPVLVGHNLKFDLQKVILYGLLDRDGITPSRIEDTELLAHLTDEHRRKGLKYLAEVLLFEQTDEDAAVKEAKKVVKKEQGFRSESEIGYHMLPREVVVPYAIKDAEFTLRLYERLRPEISRHDDLSGLYQQELELLLVLLDMESAGMFVNVEYLRDTARRYGTLILEKQLEIEALVGQPVGKKTKLGEFNPSSPEQVRQWFEDHGILVSGTDKHTLARVDHPLATALLELRSLNKMHGTYLLPLLDEQRDGIVHPNFRQNVTTGRMASGGVKE